MNTHKMAAIVVFTLVVVLAGMPAQGNGVVCNAKYDIGQQWLATGTITKVAGTTFFMLGKDNQVYEINAAESQVFVDEERVNREAWVVGDIVRVYGEVTNPCVISAERVRVFKRDDAAGMFEETPEREVTIVIEKEPTLPAGYGAGSEAETTPQPQGTLCEWTGVVTNVKYGSRALDILTSGGAFSVVIGDASVIQGNRRITRGLINIGDAISVTGTLSGHNEINARTVEITRTVTDARNSLPTPPVSVVGVIENIDYPSRTFRMQTSSTSIVVLAGPEVFIQNHHNRWTFADLRPGQRVKMSGYGSLASGYAAQHIMVIGVPR